MKALVAVKYPCFKFHYQRACDPASKATSSAYQLNLAAIVQCFIVSAVTRKHELYSTFDIFLINDKKIFEYEYLETPTFLSQLLSTLKQQSEQAAIELVCQNGYGIVSEYSLSLNKRLEQQGLSNIQPHIDARLNTSAIEALSMLKLGIIPRLYNWLIEVKEVQFQYRVNALLTYPIILVPILSPSITEVFSPLLSVEELATYTKVQEFEISQRIDTGEDVSAILETALQISANVLKEIKGKKFGEISEKNQPEIYRLFEHEIQVFEYLSHN